VRVEVGIIVAVGGGVGDRGGAPVRVGGRALGEDVGVTVGWAA
jgi:hypothetical protein